MVAVNQPSFARGEISKGLRGRVDTSLYQVALGTGRNLTIHPTGGASNRAGTRYVARQKNVDAGYDAVFLPFIFKDEDAYLIEMGDEYIRFIRGDAHITATPIDLTGITSADPGVFTTDGPHGYMDGEEVFISGVAAPLEVNGVQGLVANATTSTFTLTDPITGEDIDTSGWDSYSSGGQVALIYELTSPYAQEDLDELKYSQTADVMTLTRRGYPVMKLIRSGHNAWALEEEVYKTEVARPTNVLVTAVTTNGEDVAYKVTAISSDSGEESLSGTDTGSKTVLGITNANPPVVEVSASHLWATDDDVTISGAVGMTELNGRDFKIDVVDATHFSLRGEDATGYGAYSSGGTVGRILTRTANGFASSPKNTITWDEVPGTERYAVYREDNGIYGLVGETQDLSFLDDNLPTDLSITPPVYNNPFFLEGTEPAAVGSYAQRKVYGGSINYPDTSHFSQTGIGSNFNRSIPGQDADAISATLPADRVNEIRHYVTLKDILCFTSGSEFLIHKGGEAVFSTNTINQDVQTSWGSSHVRPAVIGDSILFVTKDRKTLRKSAYSLEADRYQAGDLSLFASHFFDHTQIRAMAFTPTPDPVVYLVLEDGHVATVTVQDQQQVLAWARWDTDGSFVRTVASLRPSATSAHEAPYFLVKREVNGVQVRYIERLAERQFNNVEEAYFVDCGLSFDNPVEVESVAVGGTITVSKAAHGLSDGDEVYLLDFIWEPTVDAMFNSVQPDQLNSRKYQVVNATTDTFDLANYKGVAIDGSDFNAWRSGGTYRKCVTTLYGLHHLEGRDVVALADGGYVSGLTVVDGKVTLPASAGLIHIGLPYVADMETLDLTVPEQTAEGRYKNITKLNIKLLNTRGLMYGSNSFALIEHKDRTNFAYDKAAPMFNGVATLEPSPEWDLTGRIFLRQPYPLPMTVLYISPVFEVGDE